MLEAVEVNKTKVLSVRMTEDEFDRVERLARRMRMSPSELVRSLVAEKEAAVTSRPSDDEMYERAMRLLAKDARDNPEKVTAAELRATVHARVSGWNERGVYELRGYDAAQPDGKGTLWGRYTYDAETDRVLPAGEKTRAKK